MLKTLIKLNLKKLLASYVKSTRSKSKGRAILMGVVLLYAFVSMGFSFYLMFDAMLSPLHDLRLMWLYFLLAASMALGFSVMLSMFFAQSSLFEAKDNELLLSMPIPPAYILTGRVISLWTASFLVQLFVLIPAGLVYFGHYDFHAAGFLYYILGSLGLSILAVALSALIGFIISAITSRLHNKSVVTMVFSLIFLALYLYGYTSLNASVMNLAANGATIGLSAQKFLYPLYCLGVAVTERNILMLVAFLAFCIIPFLLVFLVLSRNFIKIATTKKGMKRIEYKERSLKISGQFQALVKKEIKGFASKPMYMLNAGIGLVFLLGGCVYLIIKHQETLMIVDQLSATGFGMTTLLAGIIAFLIATVFISAPSISLEAKTLWILKSCPIATEQILYSKAMAHIVVCVPFALIASLTGGVLFLKDALSWLFVILIPLLATFFCALFGVTANLWFPKFDWINETVAIKQGMSTLIAMFGSFALFASLLLLRTTLLSSMQEPMFLALVCVLLALLCRILYGYLRGAGARILQRL